jgi:predicted nucleic acid-binding protein
MAVVFLDTTVLIDALRGRSAAHRVISLRRSGDTPVTSPINVEEVFRGLFPREEPVARQLFTGLRVIPISAVEGERAGRWRREHARRGVTLSQADCLVAATALTVGARLATGNVKDYPMRELVVEHWPVGR